MTNAQDFLMGGGGAPAAKFTSIGTSVTGRIVGEPQVRQQTEYGTGKPLFWDDGSPREQLVVEIQTDELDRDNPKDDGIRSVFVKGKSLTAAIRSAVKQAGAPGLEAGGILTVTYIGDGLAERGNPPKLYSASYIKPPAQSPSAAFLADPTASQALAERTQTFKQDVTDTMTAVHADERPSIVPPSVWDLMNDTQKAAAIAAAKAAR